LEYEGSQILESKTPPKRIEKSCKKEKESVNEEEKKEESN
jgi:hypothetical protein